MARAKELIMSKFGLLAMTLGVLAITAIAPADAQSVRQDAKSKVRWYNAPREIQITDDRPVIKDFREAPSVPQSIQMPPGPGAYGGMGGGGGGAMGGDGGSTLPAGGMPIGGGGGDPGYRTDSPTGPVGLPKADFGHAQTNIPARGMGPRGPLANGQSTNRLMGKLQPWSPGTGVNPNVGRAMGGRPAARMVAAPSAARYNQAGNGYGPSVGGGQAYGGSGSNTSVSARLLKKIK